MGPAAGATRAASPGGHTLRGRDGRQTARAEGRSARRHRSAPPVGPAAAGAGPHAGRFRGAGQLPAAARLPARAHARRAVGIGARRAALLRSAQHPLHHEHGDRRMGARQAHALCAAHRQRRSVHLGLRLGREAPPAARARGCTTTIAAPACSACAARPAPTSRCFATRRARSRRSSTRKASATCRSASTSSSRRCCSSCRSSGIDVRDGQQTLLAAREVKNLDELTLLNMAAAMVDGVYHDIAEALKPGIREKRYRCARNQAPVRDGLATASRRSTRSPASAAARIRTTSPTG